MAVGAQSTGFITPGSTVLSESIPLEDSFKSSFENAPWRAGGLALSPWFGVRDVSSVDIADQDSALGVTVGAGLRSYLRTGPRVYWTAHALPEYTYSDDDESRQLNGRLGGGVFLYFGGFDVELSHRVEQRLELFSSEVQALTATRRSITRLATDIRLRPVLWLRLLGERTESSNEDDDGALLAALDRTETLGQVRLEYRAPRDWSAYLGYEQAETEFDQRARNLGNDSESVLAGLTFVGNRFAASLDLSQRSIDETVGSEVQTSDETLGALQTSWRLSAHTNLLLYTRRTFTYAIDDRAAYFVADRSGLNIYLDTGPRLGFNVFGEVGEDDFAPTVDGGERRVDDVVSAGIGVEITFRDRLQLRLEAIRSEFDSSRPELDREITQLGFSFQILPLERAIRALAERLRVGEGTGTW